MIGSLFFIATAHADEDKWETHTSKEGKYSVSFPGKPTVPAPDKPDSPVGELTVYKAQFTTAKGDQTYLVLYNDYPEAALAGTDKEAFLDGVRDGTQKTVGGKVASDKKITLGEKKYPGRDFLIEKGSEPAYHARAYIVGNRLYQLVIMGPKDAATGKDADKFLDSFKLSQ
jgi:hypothetical protein